MILFSLKNKNAKYRTDQQQKIPKILYLFKIQSFYYSTHQDSILKLGEVGDSAYATNGLDKECVGVAMVGVTVMGVTMVDVAVVGVTMEGVTMEDMAVVGMATGVVVPEK